VIVKVVNNFWITGDILFYTLDGRMQEVFRFTNTPKDATVFGRSTAETVRQFVQHRVKNVPDRKPLNFQVEPSDNPRGLWVVHGTQEVDVESES